MKKVRLKSLEDFEKLPEGEWVEVKGSDLEIELIFIVGIFPESELF